MYLETERKNVLKYCRLLKERNLIKGTGGNISIINRNEGLVAISPSAVLYEEMTVEDVAVIDMQGNHVDGNCVASSEKMMHLQCYLSRPNIGGVVHTHSLYATVLACMNMELPAISYLQAFCGGNTECIPYYPFGSMELAEAAAKALKEKNALLLGNHGLLSVGEDIDLAFSVAETTEYVAEIYVNILKAGKPHFLQDDEINDAIIRVANYKKRRA